MRNTITRTMVESTVHGCMIEIVDGQPTTKTLEPVTVMGKCTNEKAMKVLTGAYGKIAGMAVVKVEETESLYEISVEDFMKHAKKIDKNN